MTHYEVMIHTQIGRIFRVESDGPQAAQDEALRRFVEQGEDGDEIAYEKVQATESVEVPHVR